MDGKDDANKRRRRKVMDRELRLERKRQQLCGRPAKCELCGREGLDALIIRPDQVICYECKCELLGKPKIEDHHYAARANDSFTVPIPGNLHRELSDRQIDWGSATVRNGEGNPLLRVRAQILGLLDTLDATSRRVREEVPDSLIDLDGGLEAAHGHHWWQRLRRRRDDEDGEE